MKKNILPVIVALALFLNMPAKAANEKAYQMFPKLYFNGTIAMCSAICLADNEADEIEATLSLYQGPSCIDSWSGKGSGTLFVSGQHNVTSGKEYRLILTYSVNGKTQTPSEVIETCP